MRTFILITILALVTPIKMAYASNMDLSKAVIHHTDSPCWTTVKDIDQWHKEKGWDGIGYHFVIYCDGSIHKGRPVTKQGAHARTGRSYSRNHYIGIALVGKEVFTEAQKQTLIKFLKDLKIQDVQNHHEECPGPGLNIEKLKNKGFWFIESVKELVKKGAK